MLSEIISLKQRCYMILLYEKFSVVKCIEMEIKRLFGRVGIEGNWEILFYQFCKIKSVEEVGDGYGFIVQQCECIEFYI